MPKSWAWRSAGSPLRVKVAQTCSSASSKLRIQRSESKSGALSRFTPSSSRSSRSLSGCSARSTA
eukprot:3577203-Rhodomonas_salina.1